METWILATFAAVIFQTARFAMQKRLSASGISATGATWARFIWSAPVLMLALAASRLVAPAELPHLGAAFWAYGLSGGLAQILATICVVALFGRRNFAVGITMKKSEVLLTVVVGWLLLGDSVSPAGFGALSLGALALLILSRETGATSGAAPPLLRRILSPSAALGIASGVFFALAGVGYRGAMLALGESDPGRRALLALTLISLSQALAMLAWFLWRDREQIGRVLAAWRPGIAIGVASLCGSFCWFVAFALQNAAYVYAVGQVELVFSILGGAVFFGERLSRREAAGIALLGLSVVLLILVV